MHDMETRPQPADMYRPEAPLIGFRIDHLACSDRVHDLEGQLHRHAPSSFCVNIRVSLRTEHKDRKIRNILTGRRGEC